MFETSDLVTDTWGAGSPRTAQISEKTKNVRLSVVDQIISKLYGRRS